MNKTNIKPKKRLYLDPNYNEFYLDQDKEYYFKLSARAKIAEFETVLNFKKSVNIKE